VPTPATTPQPHGLHSIETHLAYTNRHGPTRADIDPELADETERTQLALSAGAIIQGFSADF